MTAGEGGWFFTGGLVGKLGERTTLSNCFNSGAVTGGKATGNSFTGGLVGDGSGTSIISITNCYNTGAVTGGEAGSGYSQTGGIIGCCDIEVRNCYNTGTVRGAITTGGGTSSTGGIAGRGGGNSNITNCFVACPSVAAPGGDINRIIGTNVGGTLIGNLALITQGTWDNPTPEHDGLNGGDWTAPAAGSNWSSNGPFYNLWAFGDAGSGDPWFSESVGDYLPILNGFPDGVQPRVQFRFSGGGDGSEQTPFLIKNRADMDYLSAQVNGGATYEGKYFRLAPEGGGKVLDMGGTHFEPIGNQRSNTDRNPFRGTFDGNDCTIKGLVIDKKANPGNGDNCAALFGYVEGNTNSIRNLILEAPQVTGADASYSSTGALVGSINGGTTLSGCHTTAGNGTGFVRGGEATSQSSYTGGLAGNTASDITNSSNAIAITGGNATVNSYTGGMAGFAGDLDNCFNTATVRGGNGNYSTTGGLTGENIYITNCYNTGAVTGGSGANSSHTGGIAGYSVQITTCYNTGSVVGTGTGANANTGGLAGNLAPNLQPSSHNLALPPSLAGDAATYRIAGSIGGGATLSGNYAYVPQGTWDTPAPAHNNENGADWDGLMTSAPILQGGTGGWSNTDWTIDNTHKLLPKLQGITIPQPDVPNPFATKTITATFDTQGGSTVNAQSVDLGGSITIPDPPPTRQNYTFAGWYADAVGTVAFDFSYTVSAFSADTTIYARWTPMPIVIPPITEYVSVFINIALDDPDMREHIGLNPIEGETEVEKGKKFELRVWLNQHTDLSALAVTADGQPLLPVRTEQQPPSAESLLRSVVWTSELIYVYELTPQDDLQIHISGIRWNTGSNPTGMAGLPNPSQGGAKVYTAPGRIVIEGLTDNARVHIYNVSGQLIFSSPQGEGRVGATVPRGIYIVAVDGQRWKVVVND